MSAVLDGDTFFAQSLEDVPCRAGEDWACKWIAKLA